MALDPTVRISPIRPVTQASAHTDPGHSEERRPPAVGDPLSGLDLLCLSHLRWDSVFQRPQHLMSRCARERRVFFVEEPVAAEADRVDVHRSPEGVMVVVPRLAQPGAPDADARLQELLDLTLEAHGVEHFVAWYYTPMALAFTSHLEPAGVVYDCMDELSAFAGAPRELRFREEQLFRIADVVTTGGLSLFDAKRDRHPNVHAFPSSVDVPHFARARRPQRDPEDQAGIPRPRLGFFGVLDERLDLDLVAGVAAARPEWHLALIGPVAKIAPASLPSAPNIHYLGRKNYAELPSYLAGWDVALVPFARNEATRFLSPTKTPEYLAAGKPVVSTSIRDIVQPYGQLGLARIADTVDEFVSAIEGALAEGGDERVRRADAFLGDMSWDATWSRMLDIVRRAVQSKRQVRTGDHPVIAPLAAAEDVRGRGTLPAGSAGAATSSTEASDPA